jgi:mono/diheme cytochrome c family protein
MRRALALAVLVAGCGGGDGGRPAQPAASEDPGLTVWVAQGCGSCHRLAAAGSTAEVGPDLDAVLDGRDADEIAAKIVSPTPGSIMPEDFGERMSEAELRDLATFLAASAG